ncbi:hypothetical protein [Thermosediminibacter litoriperuensis]|uniref:Uncharacterized protein n=1 Tax=Thermosediminibacter litoriperuensis TaxID=291989 RepID=A0A5S5ABH2_9FIRM|nr:hypothetical protein [Thermosediminibacter litoriperuensis]TYP46776.1 hypothetical protein LZ11_02491 [Thermosediminibacter litoriperuensis]
MINKPFFVMQNKHAKSCGEPPLITNDDSKYYGYFENEHGEQWVFIYDRRTGTAELRGGDVGWERVFLVRNGQVNGLILNENEKMWLQACWKAATVFSEK